MINGQERGQRSSRLTGCADPGSGVGQRADPERLGRKRCRFHSLFNTLFCFFFTFHFSFFFFFLSHSTRRLSPSLSKISRFRLNLRRDLQTVSSSVPETSVSVAVDGCRKWNFFQNPFEISRTALLKPFFSNLGLKFSEKAESFLDLNLKFRFSRA